MTIEILPMMTEFVKKKNVVRRMKLIPPDKKIDMGMAVKLSIGYLKVK